MVKRTNSAVKRKIVRHFVCPDSECGGELWTELKGKVSCKCGCGRKMIED